MYPTSTHRLWISFLVAKISPSEKCMILHGIMLRNNIACDCGQQQVEIFCHNMASYW